MLWSYCLWSAFLFLLQLYFPAPSAPNKPEIKLFTWQHTPWLGLALAEIQFHNAHHASSVLNIHFVFSGSVILTPPPLLRTLGRSLPAEQFPESVLLQLDILFFIAKALFRQMFRSVCGSLFSMSTRRTKFRQMKVDVMWFWRWANNWGPKWRQRAQDASYRKRRYDI